MNAGFGTVPACANNAAVPNSKPEEPAMQKKSLISTLKAVKKANVAAAPAKNQGSVTKKTKVEYIRVG